MSATLKPLRVLLPQACTPPELAARQRELAAAQRAYQYDPNKLPPIAMVRDVPPQEAFPLSYKIYRVGMYARMITNVLRAIPGFLLPWENPEDWRRIYRSISAPNAMADWSSDAGFARQRVAGLNPTVLQAHTWPAGVPLTDQAVSQATGRNVTLAQLDKAGHVFVADYVVLNGLETRARRAFVAPLALFVRPPPGNNVDPTRLVPVAIRLGQAVNSPWVTPGQGDAWRCAKFLVQVADAIHGDLWAHLVRSHMVTNPFAIATARHLPTTHPLGALLRPHVQGLIEVNEQFTGSAAQGLLHAMAALSPDGVNELIRRAHESWAFDAASFTDDLAFRGFSESSTLYFPYLRDGFTLWHETLAFAKRFTRYFYTGPQDVRDDHELQHWLADLRSHGRVRGLPPTLHDVSGLELLLARLIFRCGPQHAAVHSPSFDYATLVPNMALYSRRGAGAAGPLRAYLPGKLAATTQLLFHYAISNARWNTFGCYPLVLSDPAAGAIVDGFLARLARTEDALRRRDEHRKAQDGIGYPYLMPSAIPNSMFA